jgi:hypothetical protein
MQIKTMFPITLFYQLHTVLISRIGGLLVFDAVEINKAILV